MNSTQCDTCKEVVDDYDNRAQIDYGEFDEEVMCVDCIENDKQENSEEWAEAYHSWKKSTVIERAYYVLKADIVGFVKIFTDTGVSPEWEDIADEYQYTLKKCMEKVKGA